MDSLLLLWGGFNEALIPINIFLVLIGCIIGTTIGMLPGIGPINAIAILFPISFAIGLNSTSALILFSGIYYGSQYGNSISSILLNIPGTASSAVTALDGNAMAKKNQGGSALAMSAIASFIGGIISIFWLIIFTQILADLAISFGPAEYFVLMIFAFTALTSLSDKSPIKAIIAAGFGLFLSTIGLDPQSGAERFIFNEIHLLDGVDFVVVVIGFFAISEIIMMITDKNTHENQDFLKINKAFITLKEFISSIGSILRSNIVGFFVGVLPGAGATIASFITYNMEKKIVDKHNTFGKGDIRGVAAPESANNSSSVGAFIPLLILGVPGSETTAVMLAALLSFGITPGPLLLDTAPHLFWGVAASMFIGNLILIILNLPLIKIFTKILLIPQNILIPIITTLSVVSIYSISNSIFDLILMLIFGAIGFIMRKTGFPLAPVILGLILGDLIELNFRRAMIYSEGSFKIFFSNVIVNTLWGFILVFLFLPYLLKRFKKNKS